MFRFSQMHPIPLFFLTIILVFLAGCSGETPIPAAGSTPNLPEPTRVKGTQLSGLDLPEHIRASGVLRVGSQETYLPAEFLAEGSDEVQGFTVDLLKEITKRLGLKLEYIHAEYAALIPGLEAGRFDLGSGGMSPNPDRLEAVDMIGYFQSGATFIVRKEDEDKYTSAQDFCGKSVGAIQGATTLENTINKENEQCLVAGKPPITLQFFTETPDGLLQVTLHRIDAYLPDFAQTLYIIQQNPGKYATIGENYYLVKYPITWTFSKGNDTRLRDAVINTLTDMMADGTYQAILSKWGVAAGAISEPAVNSLTAKQK